MLRFTSFLLLLFVQVAHAGIFEPQDTPPIALLKSFKASELCNVASNTQTYLEQFPNDTFAVHKGKKNMPNVSLDKVKETLAFICKTYQEDVRNKRQSRLHEAEFLQQHFTFYRWTPDKATANSIADASNNAVKQRLLRNIPDEEIFLTKYYTKLLTASKVRTEKFDQALYALPSDEQGLTLEQAAKQSAELTRFKYTRQQIINGVLLNKNLAEPLVWLTEEALHDVLLQGTGVLNVDGKTRFFNVHRNNGIAYDYTLGKREQARYWYFAEVPSIMGYGKTIENKIPIVPQVTLAGNVADMGLGKLFLLSYNLDGTPISRMAILADQGGAFDNNFFQLDLLVDSYRGWKDYHHANKNLPDYAHAWLMLVK